MLTYLRKYSKDPKKGIDRAWRSCQDKMLDLSGPLTKILELAFRAKETGASVEPDELIGWAQRAICQLGNANCAISAERRRSTLLKLDPKLAELSNSEAGPVAEGLLFGQPFLKELSKFVATFSGLDKAQESLKKAFRPVFTRAGRNRGRSFGRGNPGAPRGQYQQQYQQQHYRGGYQDPNFYPTRRSRNRFRRGRYNGNQNSQHDTGNTGETAFAFRGGSWGSHSIFPKKLANDFAGCLGLRDGTGLQVRNV